MKKLLSFLFIVFLFVFSVNYVGADELSPESEEQIAKQKEAIDKYCSENEKPSGCVYDENNSLYTNTKSERYNFWWMASKVNVSQSFVIPSGLKLTRGYQTFDGNGNAVFAGCYRVKVDVDVVIPSDDCGSGATKTTEKATLFVFQIVTGDSNNCKVTKSFVIPAKGTTKSYGKGEYTGQEFAHHEAITIGTQPKIAKLNEWVATENGDCPKVFGFTANSKWYTLDKNKYVFSQDASDFKIDTIAFFSGEPYKTRPGCTVEDVDGKATAEKWYESLRNNNEYRILWSAGLIDEVTKKSAQEQISAAIHEKITDCQYTICKVDSTKRKTIEDNLGAVCKNGCTLSNVKTPSDSDKAKCYCCGNSQGCVYQWIEEGGSNCGLQSSISKDQCIGTTRDLECRRCLVNAYDKAGLTDAQKSCMAGSEIAKLLTEDNLEKANDDAADEDVQKEIEENRELREDIYNKLNQDETKFDFNIPAGNLSSCVDLLGPNLTAVVKATFTILQIVAAIIAVVKGMMTLIPPILAKDADALKKAGVTLAKMAAVLIIIFLLRPLLHFLGSVLDFDVSCLV